MTELQQLHPGQNNRKSWHETLLAFMRPQPLTLLLLGFSSGLPLLLIFSSLSLWLREAGVERATVTYFSWAALGFSFKFVWAPLVDKLPLPVLSRLGKRRGWLLLAQCAVAASIILMALTDPQQDSGLQWMAVGAVLLGFTAATQDVVIDAYRIECAPSDQQGILSAAYVAGYRFAMIVAGAGALYLASYFGTTAEEYVFAAWSNTYLVMSLCMLPGILTTLLMREPDHQSASVDAYSTPDYLGFLLLFVVAVLAFIATYQLSSDISVHYKSYLTDVFANKALAAFLVEAARLCVGIVFAVMVAVSAVKLKLVNSDLVDESYVAPVQEFFQRAGWRVALLILLFVGCYRISDIVLGVISNVFYQDLGFTKNEIASVVKIFGLIMVIVGGFLGGALVFRFGVMRLLMAGAILSAGTNLLFMLLASSGNDFYLLCVVIAADNLSAGIASAAFIAFLSSLTNTSFTAMQYAIFSSLMTLIPKALGGYSGSMVDMIGYPSFFLVTALLGVPVIFLIVLVNRVYQRAEQS